MSFVANIFSDQDRRAIREAATWYARLAAHTASASDRAGWARWHAADPAHARAWHKVESINQRMAGVPAEIGMPTLSARGASRRTVLRSAVLVMATGSAAWLALRDTSWQGLTADYRTATGERRSITLADGSHLMLNTASSVDVRFDDTQRLLSLHRGEILIDTHADPQTRARPFLVRSPHGTALALGTRFLVRTEPAWTQVTVLDKAVRVTQDAASPPVTLQAGQQLRFGPSQPDRVETAGLAADAWRNGGLIAIDMPMGVLLTELARYRRGVLSWDPALDEMRVSGAFPLDDTDQALAALENNFPIRVSGVPPVWTRIGLR